MAKLNRKKRFKRYIAKRNKQLLKEHIKQAAATLKKETDNYAREIENYQIQLNEVYNGTIFPIQRYINPKATILHECTACHKEFFARPKWLLNKEDQKHVCGVDTVRSKGKEKKLRKIGDKEKAKMIELANQGMSTSKIAVHLGISRPTVSKYLKETNVG